VVSLQRVNSSLGAIAHLELLGQQHQLLAHGVVRVGARGAVAL